MARKKASSTIGNNWIRIDEFLSKELPHLWGVVDSPEDFRELRLKVRDDGTTLAIVKSYGPDGGELVCFGAGYGVSGALMAANATIQGGHWKVDKPWKA